MSASREQFRGLTPNEAAKRMVEILAARKDLRPATQTNRRWALRRTFRELAERGLDLATVTPSDVAAYREYYREMVSQKLITESYAATVQKIWNSMMRDAFGVKEQPGQGLLMKGFRIRVRQIKHLTEADFEALLRASGRIKFRNERNREAFRTYLEIVWATGARVGSLVNGNLRVCDIDWEHVTVRFRHMKNAAEHTAILTPRAAMQVKKWIAHLMTEPRVWKGRETAIFVENDGEAMTPDFVDRALRAAAVAAKLGKPVSSHVLRKSVGTLIGRENPKFAAQQLGITDAIFNRHYNQPLLEDRLLKRDILPGASWKPSTPEEIAGRALLDFSSGRLAREEFEQKAQAAQKLDAVPRTGTDQTQGYA